MGALVLALGVLMGSMVSQASAQSAVWYDWEDGVMHGSRTHMRVAPKILDTTGPTKYLRITGTRTDRDSIPSGLAAPYNRMNRSLVTMTSHFRNMPKVTPSNREQSYSARIRYHLPKAQGVNIFELFQNAPGGSGYNPNDGPKNLVRFQVGSVGKANGHLYLESRFDLGVIDQIRRYDLGYVKPNTWHDYKIKAVYSHDRLVGRFEVFVDGKRRVTIAGRSSFSSPKATQLPMVKFGAYGIDGVGTVDVDNVLIEGATAVVKPMPPCFTVTLQEGTVVPTAGPEVALSPVSR